MLKAASCGRAEWAAAKIPGVHGDFSLGCDAVAAYATIEWIEAIDTIEFWREGRGGSFPLPSRG